MVDDAMTFFNFLRVSGDEDPNKTDDLWPDIHDRRKRFSLRTIAFLNRFLICLFPCIF